MFSEIDYFLFVLFCESELSEVYYFGLLYRNVHTSCTASVIFRYAAKVTASKTFLKDFNIESTV